MPKNFLDENFLLQTPTAQRLYHEYAAPMPIIDYHCHLPPNEIAENKVFENITHIWLNGDHYKWRAMRSNGVEERYITGAATDYEKFEKWAETVPFTLRNPLYHWTHLELKNPFGISKTLSPQTCQEIYEQTKEQLVNQYSTRKLLVHFGVEVVCTTDDPLDDLSHHQKIRNDDFQVKILPTFRPDKAMAVENMASFRAYLQKLGEIAGFDIKNPTTFLEAIQKRHDYFAQQGCRLSDHGLETIYAENYTENEIHLIFQKILANRNLEEKEIVQFKSFCLYEFARMDAQKGWTQQFHIGAIRNNNSRMQNLLGADSGFDSIGDFSTIRAMAKFFDKLDKDNQLTQTIIYNLNPADNEAFATMIGNFNDGSVAGKMQYGSAWWFLDQKEGMERQMNALSNMGLISRFVGMLTDSRSFLSYSRHEYFRRILCNLFGNDIENGEIPNDLAWVGKIVQDICYYNARNYFGFYQ